MHNQIWSPQPTNGAPIPQESQQWLDQERIRQDEEYGQRRLAEMQREREAQERDERERREFDASHVNPDVNNDYEEAQAQASTADKNATKTTLYKNPFAARNAKELAPELSAKTVEEYVQALKQRAARWGGVNTSSPNSPFSAGAFSPGRESWFKFISNERRLMQRFIDAYNATALLRGHTISPIEREVLERRLGHDRYYSADPAAPSFYTSIHRPPEDIIAELESDDLIEKLKYRSALSPNMQ